MRYDSRSVLAPASAASPPQAAATAACMFAIDTFGGQYSPIGAQDMHAICYLLAAARPAAGPALPSPWARLLRLVLREGLQLLVLEHVPRLHPALPLPALAAAASRTAAASSFAAALPWYGPPNLPNLLYGGADSARVLLPLPPPRHCCLLRSAMMLFSTCKHWIQRITLLFLFNKHGR